MIVIDLEATCCDEGSIPASEQETIEIGAVFVDCDYQVVSTFESFVRPVRHPQLTAFCKQLTGITQQQVDSAKPFCDAFPLFVKWILEYDPPEQDTSDPSATAFTIASWGKFDRQQIERDCGYHMVIFRFEHIDVSRQFTSRYRVRRGHRGAMKILGVDPDGAHHRGLSDALNVAKMLPLLND
jgi:3'-5' exoribonuclease 1